MEFLQQEIKKYLFINHGHTTKHWDFNSLLPSFIIFLYDFLIWNFSYSISHTSKNKLMQSYITFPSLSCKEGEETSSKQLKPSESFPQLRQVTNV